MVSDDTSAAASTGFVDTKNNAVWIGAQDGYCTHNQFFCVSIVRSVFMKKQYFSALRPLLL